MGRRVCLPTSEAVKFAMIGKDLRCARRTSLGCVCTQCIPGGSPASSLFSAGGQHKIRRLTQSDYRLYSVAMSLACEARSLLMVIVDFASSRYSGPSSKHSDRWQKRTHLTLRFMILGVYEALSHPWVMQTRGSMVLTE